LAELATADCIRNQLGLGLIAREGLLGTPQLLLALRQLALDEDPRSMAPGHPLVGVELVEERECAVDHARRCLGVAILDRERHQPLLADKDVGERAESARRVLDIAHPVAVDEVELAHQGAAHATTGKQGR
jgi:hypothetical protein